MYRFSSRIRLCRRFFLSNTLLNFYHVLFTQRAEMHGKQRNDPANNGETIHQCHCHPENTCCQFICRLRHCFFIPDQSNRPSCNKCTDRRYQLINQTIYTRYNRRYIFALNALFPVVTPIFVPVVSNIRRTYAIINGFAVAMLCVSPKT